VLSETDKFDEDGSAVDTDVPEQSHLKYKEFLRGFRVKFDSYAKTFPTTHATLTGYFTDLRNTMAAKGEVEPFFSQPTVVADLTALWMANVSTKLLALVVRGMWTFDELMEACPPLPKRPTGVRSDNGIYVYMGKSITQNVFN